MVSKTCTKYDTEKLTKLFKKIAEFKDCNIERVLKPYNDHKEKISNQRKTYYEKNMGKTLQQQKDIYIQFKELLRAYVELENRLKTLQQTVVSQFSLAVNNTH